MAAISLKLPEDLAQASKDVAEKIGLTRAELIRQALRHELADIEARLEKAAMAEALQAMKRDATYRRDSENLEEGIAESIREEADRWWEGD